MTCYLFDELTLERLKQVFKDFNTLVKYSRKKATYYFCRGVRYINHEKSLSPQLLVRLDIRSINIQIRL